MSLGAAVALLNDLNWYLVRFADAAFVRDPSIVRRNGSLETSPQRYETTTSRPKRPGAVQGVRHRRPDRTSDADDEGPTEGASTLDTQSVEADGSPELVEPMLADTDWRHDPGYDLQDVVESLTPSASDWPPREQPQRVNSLVRLFLQSNIPVDM